MKDWSEYTLVSFGDSFTFGQDTVPKIISETERFASEVLWKSQCNEKSYTQVLCDRMGFKDNLNFGIPGNSNERSLMSLEAFLRQNPELKIFVLFNFTDSSRFTNILKVDGSSTYEIVAIGQGQRVLGLRHYGINKRTIEHYYTYFRNGIQEVYHHIKDKRMLYYMLAAHNTPHATFDVLNTVDSRILRDNPLQYLRSDDGFCISTLYHDDSSYVFAEMDFFNSYYNEVVDKSPLLSHIQLDEGNGERNMKWYINRLGIDHNADINHYNAEYGEHWTHEGHIEVAKVIEKYINENNN